MATTAAMPPATSRWPLLIAIATLVAAALALVAGPLISGGLDFRIGLLAFALGALIAAIGGLIALVLLLLKRGPRTLLIAAAVVGIITGIIFAGIYNEGGKVPSIHDITTDTADPPQMSALLADRAGAANGAEYDGPQIAAQQRVAYPDLTGKLLSVPPAAAFDKALGAARDMGWRIVIAEAAAGRIEAVAKVPWWGFKDDVIVRIRPDAGGSRIDVRSKSRVGQGDFGVNAARVRAYLAKLA